MKRNKTFRVLERSERDPLQGLCREELWNQLRERLQGRVEEAWIFGSFARDELGPESDLDLVLVVKTHKPFLRRAEDFWDLWDLGPSMDLLIYTPDEWNRLTEDPSPGFWRSLVQEKIRIC